MNCTNFFLLIFIIVNVNLVIKKSEAFSIQGFETIIQEYGECSISIYIFRPQLEFFSINAPLAIVNVARGSKVRPVVHLRSMKKLSCIAQFLVCPEYYLEPKHYLRYVVTDTIRTRELHVYAITRGQIYIFTTVPNYKEIFEQPIHQQHVRHRIDASFGLFAVFHSLAPSNKHPQLVYSVIAVRVLFPIAIVLRYSKIDGCSETKMGCRNLITETIKRITNNGKYQFSGYMHKPKGDIDSFNYVMLRDWSDVNSTTPRYGEYWVWRWSKRIKAAVSNPFRNSFYKSVAGANEFENCIYHILAEGFDVWEFISPRYYSRPVITSEAPDDLSLPPDLLHFGYSIYSSLNLAEYSRYYTYGVMLIGNTYLKFVTCDGVGEKIEFSFYTKPYTSEVWMYFLLLSVLGLPLLFVIEIFATADSMNMQDLFSDVCHIYLYITAAIFESSPSLSCKLKGSRLVLYVIVVWMLFLILLINLYKAVFVSELTSPMKESRTWTDVEAMENFFYIGGSLATASLRRNFLHKSPPKSVIRADGFILCLCFPEIPEFVESLCSYSGLGKPVMDVSCANNSRIMVDLKINPHVVTLCDQSLRLDRIIQSYKQSNITFADWLSKEPMETHVYLRGMKLDVLDCGVTTAAFAIYNSEVESTEVRIKNSFVMSFGKDTTHIQEWIENLGKFIYPVCNRIAYIDDEAKVNDFVTYTKKLEPESQFGIGDSKLFSEWIVKNFALEDVTYLAKMSIAYKRLQGLIMSGIYKMLQDYFKLKYPNEALRLAKQLPSQNIPLIKPLTVYSNVSTAFLIYLILIFLAIFIVLTEILLSLCTVLYNK